MANKAIDQEWIEHILKAIHQIDYGTVQITLHDGQITQIEKAEKVRLPLRTQAEIQSKK
ncbi:YezD family protein [Aureibacillus halotolerans]|uniref:DUF2292 domain-containing protein n=1 Tax=Aureibacillus halotolerans TaxID=1508390 RepID=A0A4R6U8H5_9BACI|nr:YezD family protein [Aureibacillus halotolerans]TDQ42880.1 hypothetical protein EV213_101310 [Aureibacillus halotolerans]